MNPVFLLLIIIGAVALWFILTFAFIPLGNLIFKKWDKTIEVLNKENNEEEVKEKWEEDQVN